MLYGGPSGAVYGVLIVFVLFGCMLLHELAHGVVAHKLGLAVSRITFLPIGILLEVPPGSPSQEIAIALVGPLANLGLGLAMGLFIPSMALDLIALRRLLEALLTPGLTGILVYLVIVNVFLGIFNLLPAFPMDGGRILRAGLAHTIDYVLATRIAAWIGRGLAIVMGLVGFIVFPMAGLPPEPALVVVAGVVFLGARHEELYVRQQRALVQLEVKDIYQHSSETTAPWDVVTKALVVRLFKQDEVLPVVIEDRVVGLLTYQETRKSLGQDKSVTIAHVMRTDFPVLQLQDTLWVALRIMNASQLARLPVVHEGVFQGTLGLDDIDRAWRLHPLRRKDNNRPVMSEDISQ